MCAVDDYLPLRDSSDVHRLRAAAASWLPTLGLDFGRVVFLGVAGQLFVSFDVAGQGDDSSAL